MTDPVIEGLCEGRTGLIVAGIRPESWGSVARRRAAAAIQCDAYDIMTRVSESDVARADVVRLHDRVRDLTLAALRAIESATIASSRLPLSSSHQEMFRLAAEAERVAGSQTLVVWSTNPWQPLGPLQRVLASDPRPLSTALMRGERRALALNVRNAREIPQSVRISVDAPGLPLTSVLLSRVNWTGNERSTWAAAELELLGDATVPREVTTLPGITQQIWIQIEPLRSDTAGGFAGHLHIESGDSVTRIPLNVAVFKTEFPAQVSMGFGGWDYAEPVTDQRYGVRPSNRAEIINYLRSRHVNTAWGHARAVMHWRDIGPNGDFVRPLDVTGMEQWLTEWAGASNFRILLNPKDGIAGILETDERFPQAVATWAQAWAAEIRRLGRSPEQFGLNVIDEPSTLEAVGKITAWSEAVRQSGAGFKIWTDPNWSDPYTTPQTLIDAADIISINLGFAEAAGNRYWEWAREVSRRGKIVEVYACDGPARRLDPHTYYRLAVWRGALEDVQTVAFWSLTYTGQRPSDHEFATGFDGAMQPYNYSPLFINAGHVRAGKHFEAAAEGIQDSQYLDLLKRVVQTSQSAETRARATELLSSARMFVSSSPASTRAQWRQQSSVDEVDRQRIAIGEFLDSFEP